MSVERIEIRRREPYEEGANFGPTGPYERVDAVLRFAVDPEHPANAGIADLDLAPRGADGRVRFEGDLCLLRPANPARGNRHLFVSVVNRGRKSVVPFSGPPPLELSDHVHPGDGFLLRRGWTVAFVGWQWDVERRPELVGFEAPFARGATARVTLRFQPNRARTRERLAHFPWHPAPENQLLAHRPYPVADLEERAAELAVQDGPNATAQPIPRARFRFPDREHVELDSGFEAGRTYTLTYTSAHCPVVGTGLLAIRDATAHLRQQDGITHAFGWGVSQTGRFLREFVAGARNLDEEERAVFDGLFIQVAGARRGEFDARGAQPSAQYTPGPWQEPPYDYDALLDAQRERGGVPRIAHVDTANEYWRSEASFVHADENGKDLELPPEVRLWTLAGHMHLPGFPALTGAPVLLPEARAANLLCTLNPGHLLRAALVNLERWIAEGVEPPPNAVPRSADAGTSTRGAVLARFAAFPGASVPDPKALPRADSACAVSAVDDDGNELAGIRHPELEVPLATYTGWNPRHPSIGAPGELLDMLGSALPFPRTRAERERTGDPRPSLEERYAGRNDYLARVRRASERLVSARWLLEEDTDAVVRGAGRLWDVLERAHP